MTVATPDLTLTITPPGGRSVDYSRFLAWSGSQQQGMITQNFGRQGDTATLPLVDEYVGTSPNVLVPSLSTVDLYDNGIGKHIFTGVVTNPALQVTAPTLNEWALTCTDNTYYADNALVQGTFNGMTVDEIVVALTQQANCGITAQTVADGGWVAPGPQLASFSIGWTKLSDAWRQLAQLAGQVVPYGWYVSEFLNLHFYDSSSAIDSGTTFTTTPTVAGTSSEGHIAPDSQNLYEWDATSLHNRILVQGATQTIAANYKGAPTDTWLGDGVTTSWPLRYTLAGTPTLTDNGQSQTVNVVSPGGTPSGQWNAQQNANGAYFLTAATPPAAGRILKIWYDYQIPIIAQANDFQSQQAYDGPNGGIFAEYISDQSLTTAPMAFARAMRERTEYAFPVERATFNTTEDWVGWVRAGEVFTYSNRFIPDSQRGYALGVTDSFLAISNQVTFTRGGYRTMQLTGVRI